jgi:hypothetical protein
LAAIAVLFVQGQVAVDAAPAPARVAFLGVHY